MERLNRTGISTLAVNQGWWPLLRRVDAQIAALEPRYRVVRLGAELGVLDLAVHPDDLSEEVENLVDEAQYESTRTCEICADRGRAYRQGDWLITLCTDHARARGARPARTDADISDAVPKPTDRELAFALSAGIPASAFAAQARRENEIYLQISADADEAEMASWLSTAGVARLAGLTSAEVSGLRRRGELFAGRRRTGRYAFPRWQFDMQNRPLVGLRAVLAALGDEDPISVSIMMTTPLEGLDGLAPVQWLARERRVQAVTQLMDEWQWT
ncbi:hypothetical protein [Microbacterium testaceum]|uniref:hypothetical protein n=1 Tax=Microbacterium testaceum TaxID=2033 RepID=UPI001246B8D3|nr:hypothetical protein [Microbacterium testaceum]